MPCSVIVCFTVTVTACVAVCAEGITRQAAAGAAVAAGVILLHVVCEITL
jgi:hypothetical protein